MEEIAGLRSVGFPSNILALDNTKRKERVLFLRDGNGKVIVTISRKALDEKNVKIARETELASLRSDYSVTYIAPEKEENWSNWYVLSGVGHGTEFYYRRWLCPDSIVSIEFEYAKELAPQFNSLIPDMVRKLIISNCGK